MDPEKVESVANWSTLKNILEVQAFLGFVNFYCQFIKGYLHIACPLTNLMKGRAGSAPKSQQMGTSKTPLPWKWTDACDKAFNWLKELFRSSTVLAHFDPRK